MIRVLEYFKNIFSPKQTITKPIPTRKYTEEELEEIRIKEKKILLAKILDKKKNHGNKSTSS